MQLCCNVGAGLLWLAALGSLGQKGPWLGPRDVYDVNISSHTSNKYTIHVCVCVHLYNEYNVIL